MRRLRVKERSWFLTSHHTGAEAQEQSLSLHGCPPMSAPVVTRFVTHPRPTARSQALPM
jgi:hypothetical protein